MDKINKYKDDYIRLKKEINNKKYTKEFIEDYVLEMKVVRADTESIIKSCEVVLLPLIIATISVLLSFVGYKSLMNKLIGVIIIEAIEIIVCVLLIKKSNNRLVFINSIIELCEQFNNKKKSYKL